MKHRQSAGISEFKRAQERENGYNRAQVDEFFAVLADDFENLRQGVMTETTHTASYIRQKSFDAEAGGYAVTDVDLALDRVEDRFAEFERRLQIEHIGKDAWEEKVEHTAALVMGRLNRPDGERFRRPARKSTKGYFVKDVDALCHQLGDHFRSEEELSPAMIRSATFASATGDMSYEETQVDAFIDRCIELMLDLR